MTKHTLFLIVLLAVLAGCGADQAVSSSTPAAPPTSKPSQATQPRLGNALSAFIARYGQPNGHSDAKRGEYHFAQYPGENTDSVIATTDTFDRGVYTQRVMTINAAAPDGGWSADQGKAICTGFFPADARYQRRVTLADGSYDEIYSSSSLTQRFPAGAFDDSMNRPTKAGLFDVHYLVNANGGLDGCAAQIGTQQSQ